MKNAKGKKIYLSQVRPPLPLPSPPLPLPLIPIPNADGLARAQNGWPSKVSNGSMRPNSGAAQASVAQEQAYFDMLDDQCAFFKGVPGGGVAWFAHIYSDAMEDWYGILDVSGREKFPFKPRTHC